VLACEVVVRRVIDHRYVSNRATVVGSDDKEQEPVGLDEFDGNHDSAYPLPALIGPDDDPADQGLSVLHKKLGFARADGIIAVFIQLIALIL
jgi:hypothetical protein